MPLEKIAADIDALVTGDASERFEQPIPFQLAGRQRGGVSRQPTIESAAWRYQGSFKADDGIHDIGGIGAAAIGGHELPEHVGIGGELFHELGQAGGHDPGAFQRCFGIRLQGAQFSLPTETEVERGVEQGKGVERKA